MTFRAARDRFQEVRVNVARRVGGALIIALAGLALLGTPAYAYLDPGTGNVVLQLLLDGLAGIAAVVKLYWAQIVRFVRGRFAPAKDPSFVHAKDPGSAREPREAIADGKKRRS